MKKDLFTTRLAKQTELTEDEIKVVRSRFIEKQIPKKTILLRPGRIADEAYYVIEGCIRVYYDKEDAEITAYFFTEDMFTNACESFIGQIKSRHFMETSEDSTVLSITYNQLQALYKEFPAVNVFFRKIMEERFQAIHHAFTSQILDSPEERYVNLLERDPALLKRIPQHQIATYLGITPISLSRIRSRLRK